MKPAIQLLFTLVLWACCSLPLQAAETQPSAQPATAPSAAVTSLLNRLAQPGAADCLTIPFMHADRPTVEVWINGEPRPLLFDTGTNACLLQLGPRWPAPARLRLATDAGVLAEVEGKRLGSAGAGRTLDYATAALLRVGGLRLREVPLRLYGNASAPEPDYAGAFAPVLLRDYLIEVDNSALEIRLHKRQSWLPAPGAAMLPLLSLPRGVFVPLVLGGKQYWFHFDTGFSGGIGLTPATLAQCAGVVKLTPGEVERYSGWHADFSYDALEISEMVLPGYPQLSWAPSTELTLHYVDGLAYRDAYRELEAYGIGGIAGSGFWQRFNYVLDYELGRLYLWPRSDWVEGVAGGDELTSESSE